MDPAEVHQRFPVASHDMCTRPNPDTATPSGHEHNAGWSEPNRCKITSIAHSAMWPSFHISFVIRSSSDRFSRASSLTSRMSETSESCVYTVIFSLPCE